MRARLLVLCLAALASVATPAPPHRFPRNYPVWRVVSPATWTQGCAELTAWVSKSGKEGAGVTVRAITPGDAPCRVEVTGATLRAGGLTVPAALLPSPAGAPAHLYLPFLFDNQSLWNRGEADAQLELMVAVDGGAPGAATFALRQERASPHRKVPYGAGAQEPL